MATLFEDDSGEVKFSLNLASTAASVLVGDLAAVLVLHLPSSTPLGLLFWLRVAERLFGG